MTISGLEAQDVQIRLLGDFAIIHARTSFKLANGQPGGGRYTDVWARQGGRWLAVSAARDAPFELTAARPTGMLLFIR